MKQIILKIASGTTPSRPQCTPMMATTWLMYGWLMAVLWYSLSATAGMRLVVWLMAVAIGAWLARVTLEAR